MPRKPGPPAEVKAERKRRAKGATAREISRELRIATMTALDMAGGVEYIYRLSQRSNPTLFVELLKKCINPNDVEGAANLTFLVQQVAIAAAPVAGVSNSPIAGHIAGPTQAANNGEVIDVQATPVGVANG